MRSLLAILRLAQARVKLILNIGTIEIFKRDIKIRYKRCINFNIIEPKINFHKEIREETRIGNKCNI